MPSPFPGMDPYLESWIWADFHVTFITALRSQINQNLPKRYIANTELFVWREEPPTLERQVLAGPDTYVAERGTRTKTRSGTATTIEPPLTTILDRVEKKQRYLRVVDSQERRIVTVLEVVSPANKTTGKTGDAYRLKREEYIGSGINLVEIDFLRAGIRPPLGDPSPPIEDFYVLVNRASEKPKLGIWPISVRDRLPLIPLPLDGGVKDVVIDLRACLDRAYQEGRYEDQLDYTRPPLLPLREPDATWARELLAPRLKPTSKLRGKRP